MQLKGSKCFLCLFKNSVKMRSCEHSECGDSQTASGTSSKRLRLRHAVDMVKTGMVVTAETSVLSLTEIPGLES